MASTKDAAYTGKLFVVIGHVLMLTDSVANFSHDFGYRVVVDA
jgi:hypothetical protein